MYMWLLCCQGLLIHDALLFCLPRVFDASVFAYVSVWASFGALCIIPTGQLPAVRSIAGALTYLLSGASLALIDAAVG